MLICSSVGKFAGSSLSIRVVEILIISSRYSFHLWICPSIDVIDLPSLSLIGTVVGRTLFVNHLIALNISYVPLVCGYLGFICNPIRVSSMVPPDTFLCLLLKAKWYTYI